MDKTGISLRVAAVRLFEAKLTFDQVNIALSEFKTICNGEYVYAEDVSEYIKGGIINV